jgi:hypothetical protein
MHQGPISLFKRSYQSSIVRDIIDRDSSIQAYTKFLHLNILYFIQRSAAICNNISQTSLVSSWHNLNYSLEVATQEENLNLSGIINYYTFVCKCFYVFEKKHIISNMCSMCYVS